MASTQPSKASPWPSSSVPFLVQFYDGNINAKNRQGRTLDKILSLTDTCLENYHDYIQYLFPLPEHSFVNPSAPLLDRVTFDAFRSREDLRDRLRLSFSRMLKFYGLQTRDHHIEIGSNWAQSSRNWVKRFNHNHLRITRIIRSLRILGLEDEAQRFFKVLEQIITGQIGDRSLSYWTRAAHRPLFLAPEEDHDRGKGADFLYEHEKNKVKVKMEVDEKTGEYVIEGIKSEDEKTGKQEIEGIKSEDDGDMQPDESKAPITGGNGEG